MTKNCIQTLDPNLNPNSGQIEIELGLSWRALKHPNAAVQAWAAASFRYFFTPKKLTLPNILAVKLKLYINGKKISASGHCHTLVVTK